MAKTRMLKTDLRTSEKVASWPVEIRYFWVLLWGYVDDYGRAKDSPLLVKADCFPLDEDITGETIDAWLWVLADAGVIVRYMVKGALYLAVVNWAEHQKPQHPAESRVPDFHGHEVRMNPSCIMHETLTPELGLVRDGFEIGNEIGSSPSPVMERPHASAAFDDFWAVYPRREDKRNAQAAFTRALKRASAEVVIEGARRYAADPNRDAKFTKHAATWLNADSWDNDPLPPRNGPSKDDRALATLEIGRRLQEQSERLALS